MDPYFFAKEEGKLHKIPFDSILYIEAFKKGCKIHQLDQFYKVSATLSRIERILPAGRFFRLEECCIVSLEKIISFDNHVVHLPGKTIPIKNAYRRKFWDSMAVIEHPKNNSMNIFLKAQ